MGDFSLIQRSKMTSRNKWSYSEGVFELDDGCFIARVRSGKFKQFTTLSKHKTKKEAEEVINDFYKNK